MRTHTVFSAAVLLSLAQTALAQGGGGRQGGGAPPTPEQFVDRWMQNDANGDGKLARGELPERFAAFADRMFENGDADKDGFLDKAELTKLADDMGQRGFGGRAGQPGDRPGAAPGAVAGAPAELSFERAMQQAGRALRQLRRSAFDNASRAADLQQIQTIQSSLIAAKGQVGAVPMAPQAKERYGDDEAKYLADLRLQLIQGIMESLALEASVIEGDAAGAKESLEHLLEAQKAGHDAFQHEEEEEEAGEDVPQPERVRPGAPTRAPGG